MEFDISTLATPAVIAAIIAASRQFTSQLDGPRAYWVALVLNVVGQVALAMAADAETAVNLGAAITNGAVGGAIISPGIVGTTKRVGLGGVMKPKRDPA